MPVFDEKNVMPNGVIPNGPLPCRTCKFWTVTKCVPARACVIVACCCTRLRVESEFFYLNLADDRERERERDSEMKGHLFFRIHLQASKKGIASTDDTHSRGKKSIFLGESLAAYAHVNFKLYLGNNFRFWRLWKCFRISEE